MLNTLYIWRISGQVYKGVIMQKSNAALLITALEGQAPRHSAITNKKYICLTVTFPYHQPILTPIPFKVAKHILIVATALLLKVVLTEKRMVESHDRQFSRRSQDKTGSFSGNAIAYKQISLANSAAPSLSLSLSLSLSPSPSLRGFRKYPGQRTSIWGCNVWLTLRCSFECGLADTSREQTFQRLAAFQ
ncbi:uncharacterized protein BDR25DRAFT_352091 [Lindgomyces ingoldianus]|uniref:Uncharacterized protein n=1 Tax=Lindgomyces ingoldianus TaxID=673940 RepID=A0ACB6R2P9_9PLEO|nr:uncharacterized protein BDR25DRAFT_352091 [Lindgomyces ingoldianus]KAF2473599.1 hypothetical protein BDR25DRAFT_352091 [Lindgomyces ingoldianus]